MSRFPTLKGSWPRPWIGSYCIPSCITHRPLRTCQISLKSKKLFVDRATDGRTYVRTYAQTDKHLRQALIGRLCRTVDLKRAKTTFCGNEHKTYSTDLEILEESDVVVEICWEDLDCTSAVECWPGAKLTDSLESLGFGSRLALSSRAVEILEWLSDCLLTTKPACETWLLEAVTSLSGYEAESAEVAHSSDTTVSEPFNSSTIYSETCKIQRDNQTALQSDTITSHVFVASIHCCLI